MKLLGSTENKINKDENGENVPHFEITEVKTLNGLQMKIANH